MIFTDILFLLAFLPISCIAMLAFGEVWEKNTACLVLSLLFLGWARPLAVLLIVLPVITTYFGGRLLEKQKSKAYSILACGTVVLFAVAISVICGRGYDLSGGVTVFAMLIFAHKCVGYLNEVQNGKLAERDFISLAVYLISYEFILFNPVVSYFDVQKSIKTRSPKLSHMATGMQSIILGLAQSAILGLSFDRVRVAALHTGLLPWGNLAIGILATVFEMYTVLDGFMKISAGLATVNGIPMTAAAGGLIPRLDIIKHLGDVYPDFARSVVATYSGKARLTGLLVASGGAGILLACGVYEGGLLCLMFAGALLAALPHSGLFEKLFAIILTLCGFIMTAIGYQSGIADIFGYGFDMSYVLFEEITRVIPWLIIGVFCSTPMPRVLAAMWREKMASSQRAYAIMRVIRVLASVVLLAVSVLAMIGFGDR